MKASSFTRVTQSAAQYMVQLAEAGRQMREHDRRLEEAGWLWDADAQQWTHPDHPNTIIGI